MGFVKGRLSNEVIKKGSRQRHIKWWDWRKNKKERKNKQKKWLKSAETKYQSAQKKTWHGFFFVIDVWFGKKFNQNRTEKFFYRYRASQEEAAVLQAATVGCYTHAVHVLQHLAGLWHIWGVGHGDDHRRSCPSECSDGGCFNDVGVSGRPWAWRIVSQWRKHAVLLTNTSKVAHILMN